MKFFDLIKSLVAKKKVEDKPEPKIVETIKGPVVDVRPPADPKGVEPKPSDVGKLSDPNEIPQCGIDLIKKFEGCKLTAYKDIVGVWTIGYGSTGKDIVEGLVWTDAQAEARFRDDSQKFLQAIAKYVRVPLNVYQRGALLCFTYNLGPANLKMLVDNSGLNNKEYLACADRMLRYNKAGGKVNAVLIRRRQAERELFLETGA